MRLAEEAGVQEEPALQVGRRGRASRGVPKDRALQAGPLPGPLPGPLRGREGRVRRRAGQEEAQEVREGADRAVPVLPELNLDIL